MAYYKEIVTKAVIGKGKKSTSSSYSIKPEEKPDTVLGCWIINNNFNGVNSNGNILVNGSFDVNIWYSYDNDTKTTVCKNNYNYSDKMNVPINSNSKITNSSEVIVNSLSDPTVTDVKVVGDNIEFNIRKEMGIEVVGDTKVRVQIEDDYDDYDEILDEEVTEETLNKIDEEIKEDYLED